MAVSALLLTSTNTTTDATSFATASITPSANKLILAVVSSISASSPNVPTCSGNGLTWVQVSSVLHGTVNLRLTVFRAMGSSPSSGAVTFDFGGQTQTVCGRSILEYADVDTSGTNGSGAVVQSATGTGTGTAHLATLAAFSATGNATFGAHAKNVSAVITPGSGFTELFDVRQLTPDLGFQGQFRDDNDTTVDASSGASADWTTIAVEIKAVDTTVALAGTIPWTSTADATLTADVPLSGTIPHTSSATLALSADVPLAGVIPWTSTAVVVLTADVPLSGTIPWTTTAAQALIATVPLAGTIAWTSTAVAHLSGWKKKKARYTAPAGTRYIKLCAKARHTGPSGAARISLDSIVVRRSISADMIDDIPTVPLGGIVHVLTHLAGVPIPSTKYFLAAYGQVLDYADSPMHGVTLPDINNALGAYEGGLFVRGGTTAGTISASANKAHSHTVAHEHDMGHNHLLNAHVHSSPAHTHTTPQLIHSVTFQPTFTGSQPTHTHTASQPTHAHTIAHSHTATVTNPGSSHSHAIDLDKVNNASTARAAGGKTDQAAITVAISGTDTANSGLAGNDAVTVDLGGNDAVTVTRTQDVVIATHASDVTGAASGDANTGSTTATAIALVGNTGTATPTTSSSGGSEAKPASITGVAYIRVF